jgi:hypothetical protein
MSSNHHEVINDITGINDGFHLIRRIQVEILKGDEQNSKDVFGIRRQELVSTKKPPGLYSPRELY